MNLITVAFGVYSIKYVSIPLFLTLRRCSILTSFFVNYLVNGKGADSRTYLKLGLVTAGALIAGIETFNRDWFGYILIWMNNLTQSICNVVYNKLNKDKVVTPIEINFFYAWLGLPVFLAYSIYSGELNELIEVLSIGDSTHRFNFLFFLGLSGSLGFMITMSTLLVVMLCTPFTINVTGNIKNAASVVLGFILFDDILPSSLVITGILVGFSGSTLYAYDEFYQLKKQREQEAEKK